MGAQGTPGDPTGPCEGPDEDAPWHGAGLGADGRSTLRLVQEGEDRAGTGATGSKGVKTWPSQKWRWEWKPHWMTWESCYPTEGLWGAQAALGARLLERGGFCEAEGTQGTRMRQRREVGEQPPQRGDGLRVRPERSQGRGSQAAATGVEETSKDLELALCVGMSQASQGHGHCGEAPRVGLLLKDFGLKHPEGELSSVPKRRESSGPFKGGAGVPLSLESLGPFFFFVQNSGRWRSFCLQSSKLSPVPRFS